MTGIATWTTALAAGALAAGGLSLAPASALDVSHEKTMKGALTSGDSLFPHQGNGGYDVSHYDVDIAWSPGSPATIDATTTITAATTGPALSSFGLDLEGLTVSSVTVSGVAATTSRIEEADGVKPGKHKLVVRPATPVRGAFTVVVHYGGVPQTRHDTDGSDEGWIPTADGATFMNQPIGSMTGFPNNNTPKDKATYTFSIDVPAGLEVVSNGEPTLPLPDGTGTRSTWVWNQTQPMASELALVSIGQYDVSNTIIDLPGRQLPQWSFVDSTFSPTEKAAIATQRDRLSGILSGLESFLGPYPGLSTGIVVDKTGVGYALETQDRPTFPGTPGSNTLVHELTHQWYGDAVAPADWNGLWVNEGMATWAPTRYAGTNTETTYFNTWNGTGAGSSLWTVPPSGMTTPQQLFGWQSYTRGAMTYEALRAAIGDTAFLQLIKQWQTDFGGQTKKWTDLIALAQQLSGRDLTAFFQDWIDDADKPAWPGKLTLALSAVPGSGPVAAGAGLTYTLTATNTGKVPLTGAVVTVDLADVLDDATLGALPAGVSLSGTTLTWSVPTTPLSGVATASFPATVRADATTGHTLTATSMVATLGGTCTACSVTHTVGSPARGTR